MRSGGLSWGVPVLSFGIAVALAAVTRLPAVALLRQAGGVTCSGDITEIQASAVNVGMAVANAKAGNMTVYGIRGTIKCNGTTTASADVQVDARLRFKLTYTDGSSEWFPSPRMDFFSSKQIIIGTTSAAINGNGIYNFSNVVADLAKLETEAKKLAPSAPFPKETKSVMVVFDPNGTYNIRLINAKCAGTDLNVPATIQLILKGGKGNTAPK